MPHGVSSNPQPSPREPGHGERTVQDLRPRRQLRRLLQFVRRGHHGQCPQTLLRRPTEEISPATGEISNTSGTDVLQALLATAPLGVLTPVSRGTPPSHPPEIPENHPSGVAFNMHDNYSYRAWQEIRQPLKMNNKLLAGLVEQLALSEPTEPRGPRNKRPFVGQEEHSKESDSVMLLHNHGVKPRGDYAQHGVGKSR